MAERIREAMGSMSPAELARAAKVTPGAVTQWLDGTTKSLKAEKAGLLEVATGYRASWIVTGKGAKKVHDAAAPQAPGSPFSRLSPAEWEALGPVGQAIVEDVAVTKARDLLREQGSSKQQRRANGRP